MFKNTAAKFIVFAFDTTTNAPKTGDGANLTAYVAKDYGTVTVLADTSATEMDATNAPGYYLFDAAQGETNGDCLLVSGKSSTANIKVLGAPAVIYTRPTTGWLAPATAARTLVVDASGLADANAVKVGPTGAGTAQTARDLGASVLLSSGSGAGQLDFTSGVVKANATQWLGGTIPAVTVTGVPLVDLKYTLGTISPATAGSVRADAVTAAVAITSNIKKNQALAKFEFLMTDSTLHSPSTGLTVTCTRSIDGAAYGAGTLANVAEVSNGIYSVDFGAGDLNGNVITLRATAAASDDAFERIVTQP